MKCIVVDDEPLAREAIKLLVQHIPELHFAAEFSHADAAGAYLLEHDIGLVFLDIQMPRTDGLTFARSIGKNTHVIFTTAYSQYALESYEIDALDYLLKPVKISRFEKAVNKAFTYQKLLEGESAVVKEINHEYCFVKADKKVLKVAFDKVLYIEGLKDYVILHTAEQKIITAMNIKTIQSQLPESIFIRTSKSYLINKMKIDSFDNNTVYIGPQEIPLGNSYRAAFFEFVNRNLLSR